MVFPPIRFQEELTSNRSSTFARPAPYPRRRSPKRTKRHSPAVSHSPCQLRLFTATLPKTFFFLFKNKFCFFGTLGVDFMKGHPLMTSRKLKQLLTPSLIVRLFTTQAFILSSKNSVTSFMDGPLYPIFYDGPTKRSVNFTTVPKNIGL